MPWKGTDFEGALVAAVSEGKLAIRSNKVALTSLRISNSEGQTTPGGERLGFGDGQSVDQIRLQSLQDLEQIWRSAGVGRGAFQLLYDRTAGRLPRM